MVSTLGPSRVSRRNKDSQFSHNIYASSRTKDSKAQHLLGISRAELKQARTQCLVSKTTPAISERPYDKKAAVYGPRVSVQERFGDTSVSSNIDMNLSPIVLDNDSVTSPDTVSISDVTSLHQQSSHSTLRSSHDATPEPVKTSQQTSNESSHEFALHKGSPFGMRSKNPVMENTRHLKFFKSSKVQKPTHAQTYPILRDTRMSVEYGLPHYTIGQPKTATQVSLPPLPSLSTTPESYSPHRASPRLLRRVQDHPEKENIKPVIIESSTYTPYAKVNVRRPKPGTEHWFDDLELDTDEEDNPEPELQQNFMNEFERDFQNGHIGSVSSFSNRSETDLTANHVSQARRESMIGRSYSDMPPAEFRSTMNLLKHNLNEPKYPVEQVEERQDPFAEADLSSDSVLYLSSSDEDIASHAMPQGIFQYEATSHDLTASGAPRTPDVEIGQARAVNPFNGSGRRRPSLIQLKNLRGTESAPCTPTISSVSPAYTSGNDHLTFYRSGRSLLRDDDESVLISSFPATPAETGTSRKPSLRSSMCLSDDASIVSTRFMKVTKQEEALIAAMRLKKIAMKREKDRNRRAALEVLENNEKIVIPTDELRRKNGDILTPEQQGDVLAGPSDRAGRRTMASVTTFQTESTETRNSQMTFFSNASDDQLPWNLSPLRARPLLQGSLVTTTPRQHRRTTSENSRADTYLTATTDDSERRHSPIVVLDNLNAALRRHDIPSQLFIVSPFTGWERAGLAVAR